MVRESLPYERFFALSVDLCCIADTEGFIRVVNAGWERVLGWTPVELTARPYIELVHPDDVPATVEIAGALARGEAVQRFVNRYRCKGGGYRRLEWSATMQPGEATIYAIARDVTEASRGAARRVEIEQVAGVGSWELDLESNEVRWSEWMFAIHEADPARYQPKVDDALRFYPPEAQVELLPALGRLMTSGAPYDLELPFVTAKGRRLWVRASAAAEIRAGRVVRAFGTIQDMTAQREAAEALRIDAERHRLAQSAAGVGGGRGVDRDAQAR